MLSRRFIQFYQLGYQTYEDSGADSKSRLDRAMERIYPGMVAEIEENNAAHIASNPGRIPQAQEMAKKHGCQNSRANFPCVGPQYGTSCCPKNRPQHGSGQTRKHQLS